MQVIRTEKVNTNNAWGFGGFIGTYTYYDNGIVIKKGRLFYRHLPPSSQTTVSVAIDDVFHVSVVNPVSKYVITNLKGVDTITLLKYETRYYAVADDVEAVVINGEEYQVVRKINI
jgi:hypothetical protein